MSIAVKCDECGKQYRVKDAAAGKSFPCKECDNKVRVPRPKKKKKQPEVDPWDDEDEWDDAEAESLPTQSAPVRKGTRKKKKRKQINVSGALIAKICIPVVLLTVLVSIYKFVEIDNIVKAVGLPGAHERNLQSLSASAAEEVALLATITDKASAEVAAPKLKTIHTARLILIAQEKALNRKHKLSREESKILKDKYQSEIMEHAGQHKKELIRIRKIPEAALIVAQAIRDASSESSNTVREIRMASIRDQADAEGYSAVSSWTSLAEGTRVEFIQGTNWKRGTVREILSDGKIMIESDFFRGSYQAYEKADLRIPDNPTPDPVKLAEERRRKSLIAKPRQATIAETRPIDRVTVKVSEDVDSKTLQEWVEVMKKNIDPSLATPALPSRAMTTKSNGYWRIILQPVRDIQKFADAINFANVDDIDERIRYITISPK